MGATVAQNFQGRRIAHLQSPLSEEKNDFALAALFCLREKNSKLPRTHFMT